MKQKLLETNFFIDNEFLDKYCLLIDNNRQTQREIGVTQLHHIVPRCVYKMLNQPEDNSVSNLVNLVYKDHILAHYYLALASSGQMRYNMIASLKFMVGNVLQITADDDLQKSLNYFISQLDNIQQLYADSKSYQSELTKVIHTGRKRSEETKKRISESTKKAYSDPILRKKISEQRKGQKLSLEHKKALSKAKLGKKRGPMPQVTRDKISIKLMGKVVSEQARANMSKARQGKAPWNKGKKYSREKACSEATKNKISASNGTRVQMIDPETKVIVQEFVSLAKTGEFLEKEFGLSKSTYFVQKSSENFDTGMCFCGYQWKIYKKQKE